MTDVLNGLNGVTAFINAMHVTDLGNGSKLYVGGSFTSIEGFSTSSIAAWNGTNWSALGIGIADPAYPAVSAITTFDQGDGPSLYVGGLFSSAGGVTAAHIARFKNGVWSALDGGLTGSPTFNSGLLAGWAMSPYRNPLGGEALYIGGAFDVADGLPSKFIASWEADPQSNSCAVLGSAADSGVGIGAGGPFDVLRVQGRAGNGHRVNVGIAEPLTISIEQPPTVPYSTGFALFGMLGVPGAGDVYAMPLGVGDFAFTPCPVAPLDPLLFLVASDFAVGCAPLLPAGGTPWLLAAPALGFPADVTIQAVVGDLSAPFGLSKTNAILITIR